jgi:hypothetical protein
MNKNVIEVCIDPEKNQLRKLSRQEMWQVKKKMGKKLERKHQQSSRVLIATLR